LITIVTILLSDKFEKIVNYIMFIDSSSLIFAAITIFILRRRMKADNYDGFKMKLFPIIPVLFILVLTIVCVSDAAANPKEVLVSLGVLLAGYPLYHLLKLRKGTV